MGKSDGQYRVRGKRIIQYAMLTEDGGRALNEDSIGHSEKGMGCCFVLADGLGGHGGGDLASQLVTGESLRVYEDQRELSPGAMGECFSRAQSALLAEQQRLGRTSGMKSTLVIWMTDAGRFIYGHIGDSRLYVFEQGVYVRRTLDHSVPQMLVLAGEISEQEIRGHADRSRLLRAMGVEWNKTPYKIAESAPLEAGQTFLLCSDGFWEWLEEARMEALLREAQTPGQWLENMEREVLKNAGGKKMDNYSAIAIAVK